MKLNMDTIQFDDRYEIQNIINALEEYSETHKDNKDVQKLINLLDVMLISW